MAASSGILSSEIKGKDTSKVEVAIAGEVSWCCLCYSNPDIAHPT
jgi:hypothetical protein